MSAYTSILAGSSICFNHVHNCSVKHFYDGCFQTLSGNFNISVILVLTFIESFVTQLEIFLIVGMASDFFLMEGFLGIMARDSGSY